MDEEPTENEHNGNHIMPCLLKAYKRFFAAQADALRRAHDDSPDVNVVPQEQSLEESHNDAVDDNLICNDEAST